MNQIKTAVVILNWNGKDLLEQFLPSVVMHTTSEAKIIIVDNHSTDDSVSFLKQNYSDLELICLDTNNGYAGGYNEALKQIKAEYYVLLNSDVEVSENWIEPVIQLMEKDNQIAAAQPKILSWHNKSMFEYAGAAGGWIDKYAYPFCRGRIFETIEKDEGQYDDFADIFWATGACLFVRAEIYHKSGGLDESFFAHMEEIDLCWRLQNQGLKLKYVPGSVVYHLGGGSLPKDNPRKTFLNFRNNLLMMHKNLDSRQAPNIFLVRFIADMTTVLYFFAGMNFKSGIAVVKAYLDFWKTKKNVQKTENPKPIESLKGVLNKSIVVSYFLKRKKIFNDLFKLS